MNSILIKIEQEPIIVCVCVCCSCCCSVAVESCFTIINLGVLSSVLGGQRSFDTTVRGQD